MAGNINCRIIPSTGLKYYVVLLLSTCRCLHKPSKNISQNIKTAAFIMYGRQWSVIGILSAYVYHMSPTQAAQILWH